MGAKEATEGRQKGLYRSKEGEKSAIYKAKPIAFCVFAFNLEHVLLTTAHTCTRIAAHSRLLSSLYIDVLYVAPPPVFSQNFDFISHLLHQIRTL